jgi:putative heme-binding domain-containing protein
MPLRRALVLALIVSPTFAAQSAPAPKAYRDFALRRDGNADRGRELFLNLEKTACLSCHSVDGSSSKAGPDLQHIGDKFPRRELVDAILDPNASIAIGYEATTIETVSGASFHGVIKAANDTAVELMGADGVPVHVATRDITARRTSAISLMPAGIHETMTVQEFADLVEYLATLREPATSAQSHRGMPATIPELPKPVALQPLFPESLRFPASIVRRPGDARLGLTWFGQIPGQPNLFLAAHQSGQLWLVEKNPAGDTKSLFADFSAEFYSKTGPNGLLGVAFHPRFRENRAYYVKHQVMEDGKLYTVIDERHATADARRDSGEPARRLMAIECVTINHTGGCIEFGPDGYLYIGMGDTGPQQDPNGHGQNLQLLLGKMLRIDVDRREGDRPYSIPQDNPFRGQPDARPEIWALGFREPWRFSFDRSTGDLWVGDVGQDRIEEVSIVRRGENHGWNIFEGFEPFSNRWRRAAVVYTPPVFAYKRTFGNSVTGGYVYRGDPRSSFHGVYVFGDYTSRRIWGLRQSDRVLQDIWQIATAPENVASFAIDEAGNIYVVGYEGMIYRLDFATTEFPPLHRRAAFRSRVH